MSPAKGVISANSALAQVDPGEKYRLSRQVRAWDRDDPMVPQRRIGQAGVEYGLEQMLTDNWNPSDKSERRSVFKIVLSIISVLALIAAAVLIMYEVGMRFPIALVVALVPTVVVVSTLIWINRWCREPRGILLLSFLWGAGIAVGFAIVANSSFVAYLSLSVGSEFAENAGASLVAPLFEEILKGVGVLIIMLWRKRDIQSPLDGFVYGGMVGIGFAFSENILYFGRATTGIELFILFIGRAVASPFIHSMFTSMTGLAIAIGFTRMKGRAAWLATFPVGLISAMVLHGLWNGISSVTSGFSLVLYVLWWIPIFLLWLVSAIVVSSRQRRWIIRGLRPYVEAGWIHPQEGNTVCSLALRRKQRAQVRRDYGKKVARKVKEFHTECAALALDWVTAQKVGVTEKRVNGAIMALNRIETLRRELMAPAVAPTKATQLANTSIAVSNQKIKLKVDSQQAGSKN